ncbi:MAG: repeat containing protein [Cyanobacteria bacterium RYN_339]|nr:repeat containing protein [Cyanobacteria bacterium RYN_339]
MRVPQLSALALAALALSACTAAPKARLTTAPIAVAAAGTRPSPALRPAPQVASRSLIEVPVGGTLDGVANFERVTDPYFNDSAALHLLAMPVGHGLVVCSTLEEELLAHNNVVLTRTANAAGAFHFTGEAPSDRPFVVNAGFVQNHRLSALVPQGAGQVTVDEATSLVTEMARWQLRNMPKAVPDAGEKSLRDVTAGMLDTLNAKSRALLPGITLPTGDGDVPSIEALQAGSGHKLRNAYVTAFGTAVTADPASVADADVLSDAWQGLLGFRPLALARLAGNGGYDYLIHQDEDPVGTPMGTPTDATADAAGNVFITEYDSASIRCIPATDLPGGLLGHPGAMTAGKIYTVIGASGGGPLAVDAYETQYVEGADVAAGAALFTPLRTVLEPLPGVPGGNFVFSAELDHRLMFVPGADATRFGGRVLQQGHLYTIAGTGVAATAPGTGDGGLATAAGLAYPSGVAADSRGNVYVLDAGDATGTIRLVRNADGKIITLPMLRGGLPYAVPGATTLRLVEAAGGNWLYAADTRNHLVFRLGLPADLATLDVAPPPAREIEPILGRYGVPGFIDVSLPGVNYPDPQDLSDGIAKGQALLASPVGLDFDAAGNLVVADAYRVRLLEKAGLTGAGNVFTLAGGLDVPYLEGDARLAFLPGTQSIHLEPTTGNFLLTDRKENLLRRLWTTRGAI